MTYSIIIIGPQVTGSKENPTIIPVVREVSVGFLSRSNAEQVMIDRCRNLNVGEFMGHCYLVTNGNGSLVHKLVSMTKSAGKLEVVT